MVLSMFKNASNQKTDGTLKDQLFEIYSFVAWQDSSTPKVLKLHFVSVKHGSVSIYNIACSMFDIEAESCLTETKCNFRTLGVDESFWAKQQSCIFQKVGHSKWRLFFDSMHF